MSAGWVYVLSNPDLDGKVKVGYSVDPVRRCNELYTTGVPKPFEIETAFLFGKNADRIEKKTHRLLSKTRESKDREFFECTPHFAAEKILEAAESLGESVRHTDPKLPTQDPSPEDDLPEDAPPEDPSYLEIKTWRERVARFPRGPHPIFGEDVIIRIRCECGKELRALGGGSLEMFLSNPHREIIDPDRYIFIHPLALEDVPIRTYLEQTIGYIHGYALDESTGIVDCNKCGLSWMITPSPDKPDGEFDIRSTGAHRILDNGSIHSEPLIDVWYPPDPDN